MRDLSEICDEAEQESDGQMVKLVEAEFPVVAEAHNTHNLYHPWMRLPIGMVLTIFYY